MVKRLLLAAAASLVLGVAPGAGGAPTPSRIAFAHESGGPAGNLTSLYTPSRRNAPPPSDRGADPAGARNRCRQGPARWLAVIPATGGRAARIGRFAGALDPSLSPRGVP